MKDRRGFLKLLGIGAGATVGAALAAVAAKTGPPAAPRTIQDIEAPKPYIGPDSVPGGDYIKERPKIVPEIIKTPDLIPLRFDIDVSDIDWDDILLKPSTLIPTDVIQTGGDNWTYGTYDHNLSGYLTTDDIKS